MTQSSICLKELKYKSSSTVRETYRDASPSGSTGNCHNEMMQEAIPDGCSVSTLCHRHSCGEAMQHPRGILGIAALGLQGQWAGRPRLQQSWSARWCRRFIVVNGGRCACLVASRWLLPHALEMAKSSARGPGRGRQLHLGVCHVRPQAVVAGCQLVRTTAALNPGGASTR